MDGQVGLSKSSSAISADATGEPVRMAMIEISNNGKWLEVPALDIDGMTIILRGGLIKIAAIHDEQWLERQVEDPEVYIKKLKDGTALGSRADIFTFTQKLPATSPKYRYPMEWESLAVVRLNGFDEWWKSLPQETRKNVRRSQKRGVVIAVQKLDEKIIKGLMELNNDSTMKQGKPNKHYGKTFEQVKKDYSSFLDRSDLVGAYSGEELIGLLKIVYRGEVASILQCFSKARHHDKRPNNALLAKAIELCSEKGISYLTYGLFKYGNKTESPFLEFKIRNGFEEVLVPRFYVPLTGWGSICVASKLYRGPLAMLPHRVLKIGVNLRAQLYLLKHRLAGVAQW